MKKYMIILIAILLSTVTSGYCQDSEPSPLLFNMSINGRYLNNEPLDTSMFKQTSFALGCQWGGNISILKILKMNYIHCWEPNLGWTTGDTLASNTSNNYILNHVWYAGTNELCRGFQFNPTLYIPESRQSELITKANDTTKSVFGFSYIKDTNQLKINPNSNRYNLYKDSLNYINSVVLAKSWINNKYSVLRNDKGEIYDGNNWIFSINLRRLNKSELIKGHENDTVLVIKLPYKYKATDITYGSDVIKFKNLPKKSLSYAERLNYREDRGYLLNYDNIDLYDSILVITNSMLPDADFINSTGRQDITINAFYVLNTSYNHGLKTAHNNANKDEIDSLDIEVTYKGHEDIGINYCRIVTENGYKFINGSYDNDFKSVFVNTLPYIQGQGYNVSYFYGRDELAEEYFLEQQYKAALLNHCIVSEGAGGNIPMHYTYNVSPAVLWFGSHTFQTSVAEPYINLNHLVTKCDSIEIFRLLYTKFGMHYGEDTLNSGYETCFSYAVNSLNVGIPYWLAFRKYNLEALHYVDSSWADVWGMELYRLLLLNSHNPLSYNEWIIYNQFYKNSKDIYSNKYWWSNTFPCGFWKVDSLGITLNGEVTIKPLAIIANDPPQTGESLRLNVWQPLIFGAKGIFYDARCDFLNTKSKGKDSGPLGGIPDWYMKKYVNNPDSLIFSRNPNVGTDFIPDIDSATNITSFIIKDSTAKYLGVPRDRIYYARKSVKTEMYKTHTWIRAVEPQLMRLRLAAAYSKAARIWRNYDSTRYTSDPLDKWLRLDNRLIIYSSKDSSITLPSDIGIKTKPLTRNQIETWDSSFVDVTLLADTNDRQMENNAYLGICNRRTDPLIYLPNSDKISDGGHMQFFSTAEFDDSCRFSEDSLKWQSYYNKRLGAREIRTTFQVNNTPKEFSGTMLHITELGKENSSYMSNFWMAPKYHHTIDTIITEDGILRCRTLPGEGKLLKINHIDVTGDSCNFCQIVKVPGIVSIEVQQEPISDRPIPDSCCWYFRVKNNAPCKLRFLPITLICTNIELISAQCDLSNEEMLRKYMSNFTIPTYDPFLKIQCPIIPRLFISSRMLPFLQQPLECMRDSVCHIEDTLSDSESYPYMTMLLDSMDINEEKTLIKVCALPGRENKFAIKFGTNKCMGTLKITVNCHGISSEVVGNEYPYISNPEVPHIKEADSQETDMALQLKPGEMHIYPNPTSDNTNVEFNLAQKSNVKISIVDRFGNKVLSDVFGEYPQGRNKVELNTISLCDGIYFVVLQSNNFNLSSKLIILH